MTDKAKATSEAFSGTATEGVRQTAPHLSTARTGAPASNPLTLAQARAVINAHRDAEYAAKHAEALPYLGRYFKYRNSYSGGDKWWMYAIVEKVSEIGWPSGFSFERTSNGQINIDPDQSIHIESGGWKEITAGEYFAAAAVIRNELVARLSPSVLSQTEEGK